MAPVLGSYRRPLLGLSRADTVAACRAEGLATWEDPHNDDPAFAPGSGYGARCCRCWSGELGPGVAEALARTARLLRDDADALDALAEEAQAAAADGDGLRVDVLLAARGGAPAGAAPGRAGQGARPPSSSPCTSRRSTRCSPTGAGRRAWTCPAPARRAGPTCSAGACGRLTSMDEKHVEGDTVNVLYTEEQIQNRLAELAAAIERDYEGKEILVGILKGAVMVMADLARHFGRHVEMDWMAISSTSST